MKAKKRKQVGLTTQIETAYIKSENTIGDQKYNDKDISEVLNSKNILSARGAAVQGAVKHRVRRGGLARQGFALLLQRPARALHWHPVLRLLERGAVPAAAHADGRRRLRARRLR